MFGISGTELFFVAVFAFIIFGPDKVPEIARTVSKAIAMFKSTQEDMERTIRAEMDMFDPESDNSIFKPSAPSDSDEAAAAPKKTSSASSLYEMVDDEEEDEE